MVQPLLQLLNWVISWFNNSTLDRRWAVARLNSSSDAAVWRMLLAMLAIAYRAHPSGRLERLQLRHRMEAVAAQLQELADGVDP